MEGLLKVTPEKLIEAAGEFSSSGQTISSLTQEMMNIVNSLKGIWQGEAAGAYSGRFAMLQDDIETINRMIQEHVSDLNEMAREYQSAENASIEQSNQMLTDVVS